MATTVVKRLFALLVLSLASAAAHAAALPSLDGEPAPELFRSYVGETFRVYGGEGNQGATMTEELVLEKVIDAGSTPQVLQFQLLFKAKVDSALRKTTYAFEHATGGTTRLFIEPVTGPAGHRWFESRFSLLRGFDPAKAPKRGQPRESVVPARVAPPAGAKPAPNVAARPAEKR